MVGSDISQVFHSPLKLPFAFEATLAAFGASFLFAACVSGSPGFWPRHASGRVFNGARLKKRTYRGEISGSSIR
jgi:hypothetical protein